MQKVLFLFFILFFSVISFAEKATVKYVIDGDTFVTTDEETVRMLGVNSTEREEWFYKEAKEYLKALIHRREVDLQIDPVGDEVDNYGRLLRYVYIDGQDINKKMIESGFAYAFLRYKISKKGEYAQAEQRAKRAKLGLWSDQKPEEFQTEVQQKDEQSRWLYTAVIATFILLVGWVFRMVKTM